MSEVYAYLHTLCQAWRRPLSLQLISQMARRMAFPCRHLQSSASTSVLDGSNSRYAPTPRLIFSGNESFLNASVIPRIASGGPSFTFAKVEAWAMRFVGALRRAAARAADRMGHSMVCVGPERLLKGATDGMNAPALDHSTRLMVISCCDGSAPVKAACG